MGELYPHALCQASLEPHAVVGLTVSGGFESTAGFLHWRCLSPLYSFGTLLEEGYKTRTCTRTHTRTLTHNITQKRGEPCNDNVL